MGGINAGAERTMTKIAEMGNLLTLLALLKMLSRLTLLILLWLLSLVTASNAYTTFQGWAGMTFKSSGTRTGMDNSIPEVREREGNGKNPFPKFGNGRRMKKSIPKIREREENEKNPFQHFGNGNQRLSFQRIPGNGNGNEKNVTWQWKKHLANMWKHLANTWERVLAHTFSTPSYSILDNPPSSCRC